LNIFEQRVLSMNAMLPARDDARNHNEISHYSGEDGACRGIEHTILWAF
jgi:hypothetical protein